ncbi:hypothetical protein [Streptomyces sp. NPDC029721]
MDLSVEAGGVITRASTGCPIKVSRTWQRSACKADEGSEAHESLE